MSCKCPSRFTEFVYWITKAPFINIPIFVIGILLFWELLSQQYVYHMFIPTGFYAQLAEYFMLLVVAYFSYREFKLRNRIVDECNYIQYKLRHFPLIRFILNVLIFLLIGYLTYYMLLLYTNKFNLPSTSKRYEVLVQSYSKVNRKKCKSQIKTNIFDKLSISNETLLYKLQKEFNFDYMCVKDKKLWEGQTVIIDVKQTPFGVYVYDLKPKVY